MLDTPKEIKKSILVTRYGREPLRERGL